MTLFRTFLLTFALCSSFPSLATNATDSLYAVFIRNYKELSASETSKTECMEKSAFKTFDVTRPLMRDAIKETIGYKIMADTTAIRLIVIPILDRFIDEQLFAGQEANWKQVTVLYDLYNDMVCPCVMSRLEKVGTMEKLRIQNKVLTDCISSAMHNPGFTAFQSEKQKLQKEDSATLLRNAGDYFVAKCPVYIKEPILEKAMQQYHWYFYKLVGTLEDDLEYAMARKDLDKMRKYFKTTEEYQAVGQLLVQHSSEIQEYIKADHLKQTDGLEDHTDDYMIRSGGKIVLVFRLQYFLAINGNTLSITNFRFIPAAAVKEKRSIEEEAEKRSKIPIPPPPPPPVKGRE